MFKKDNNSYILEQIKTLERRVNELSSKNIQNQINSPNDTNDINDINRLHTLEEINRIFEDINKEKLKTELKIDNLFEFIQKNTLSSEINEVKDQIKDVSIEINIINAIIENLRTTFELTLKNNEEVKGDNIKKIYISIVPNNFNNLKFSKIKLKKGVYFVDFSITFLNNNIVNDASVILDLLAKVGEKVITIGRSSHTWYGKNNGNDIYNGYQTVIVNGVLEILENKDEQDVEFYINCVDKKHCVIVTYLKEYPALLRIY